MLYMTENTKAVSELKLDVIVHVDHMQNQAAEKFVKGKGM